MDLKLLPDSEKNVFTGEGFNSRFTRVLCTPDNPLWVLRFQTSVKKEEKKTKNQQFFLIHHASEKKC